MTWTHPTGCSPKVIDIIALGPSQRDYHAAHASQYNPGLPAPDEVWTINKGIRTVRSDMAFILDDLEGEKRKSERYALEILEYAKDRPVITSELTPCEREYWSVGFHDYPLTPIIDHIGHKLAWLQGHAQATPADKRRIGLNAAFYLHNSVPMILAYALFIGVTEIRLYGADYTIRASDNMEENRPNAEYWVGFLRGMGVRILVPPSTTLLNTDQHRRTYGYARDPVLGPLPEE